MIPYETLLQAAWRYYRRAASDLRLSKTTRNQAATRRDEIGAELDAYERGAPLRFLEEIDGEPERKLQHVM